MWAPKGDKLLFRAWEAANPDAFEAVGCDVPDYRPLADTLAGLRHLEQGNYEESRRLLAVAYATGREPSDWSFVEKYLPAVRMTVGVAPGVSITAPVSRELTAFALAELHQLAGDTAAAIDVVERLDPSAPAAVSLAELYCETGRYDDVIDLTNGISNTDDATALLCAYRGIAFTKTDECGAAREAFKEALKSKSRAAPVRHLALMERANCYLAEGKKGMARKDLERILAEDASSPGVKEALAALA